MKIFSIVRKALRKFFDLFQFSFIPEQSFQTKFTTKENPTLLGKIRRKKLFQNHEEKILFHLNFTRAKNSHEQKNPNTNNEYSCSYEEHSILPQANVTRSLKLVRVTRPVWPLLRAITRAGRLRE